MKILIILPAGISQFLTSTPLLRAIKRQLPGAVLHLITEGQAMDICRENQNIDRCFDVRADRAELPGSVAAENYDHIFNFRKDELSDLLISDKRSTVVQKPRLPFLKNILQKLGLDATGKLHPAQRYFEFSESIGVRDDGGGLDYSIPRASQVSETDIPMSHAAGFVGVVISEDGFANLDTAEKWKSFCQRVNHPIMLIGGPEVAEKGRMIASTDPVKIYNAGGKFSLHETADLINRAKMIVSGDDGLLYIAAALKKPIVVLSTPSAGARFHRPYRGQQPPKKSAEIPFPTLASEVQNALKTAGLGKPFYDFV